MGRRVEPRAEVQVPVRIFGTDSTGAVFTEKVTTVNVSRHGVELAGVRPKLAIDEIVGTAKAGHIGLLNISPEKPLWDFDVPVPCLDPYQATFQERRAHPRFRCHNPVEIHVHNGPSFWGTVAELSVGGCYVEMPIPLERGTKVRIGIWIGQAKAWAEAEVTHRTPGMGIGVKFSQISQVDLDQIGNFLQNLNPLAKKRLIGTPTQR